jgi:Spy/CpxP family protein refolding chaperone
MFRTRLGIAGVILGLLMFGASALAQQTQQNSNAAAPQQPGAQRQMLMRRMMKRRREMGGGMHGLRQLNLTDQQKQQLRSIRQTQGQGAQAQRQEMRQLMEKRRAGTLTAQDETRAKELRQQFDAIATRRAHADDEYIDGRSKSEDGRNDQDSPGQSRET